jgi:hypothetical protein
MQEMLAIVEVPMRGKKQCREKEARKISKRTVK